MLATLGSVASQGGLPGEILVYNRFEDNLIDDVSGAPLDISYAYYPGTDQAFYREFVPGKFGRGFRARTRANSDKERYLVLSKIFAQPFAWDNSEFTIDCWRKTTNGAGRYNSNMDFNFGIILGAPLAGNLANYRGFFSESTQYNYDSEYGYYIERHQYFSWNINNSNHTTTVSISDPTTDYKLLRVVKRQHPTNSYSYQMLFGENGVQRYNANMTNGDAPGLQIYGIALVFYKYMFDEIDSISVDNVTFTKAALDPTQVPTAPLL